MRKAESMSNAKHILIAVDDSEASYRAVTYVGSIMRGGEGFRVCLLHALPPLPRELLEFGGSGDPQHEEREEMHLHTEQARWSEAAAQAGEPVFTVLPSRRYAATRAHRLAPESPCARQRA